MMIPEVVKRPLRPVRRRLNEILVPTLRRDRIDNANMALLLAFGLTVDANCVDIGANEGSVLDQFVRLAPHGRHIAFEPIPACAERLRRRFPMVDVRQMALSDHQGRSSFVHAVSHPYLSGLRQRPTREKLVTEAIDVELTTLDSALPKGYVPNVIKLDVEGAEGLVLAGALKTIVASRPIVIFEHGRSAAAAYGTTAADVYRVLVSEAGLRIFDLDGQGPYSLAEFTDATADDMRWNYVAHR
jgi:FkbM family methyltransferase